MGLILFPYLCPLPAKPGHFSSDEAAFWAGDATGVNGLAMFITAPIWGIVSDRWGQSPCSSALISGCLIPLSYSLLTLMYWWECVHSRVCLPEQSLPPVPGPPPPRATSCPLLWSADGGSVRRTTWSAFRRVHGGYFRLPYHFRRLQCLLNRCVDDPLFSSKELQTPEPGQRTSLSGMLHLAVSRKVFPLLLVIAALSTWPYSLADFFR